MCLTAYLLFGVRLERERRITLEKKCQFNRNVDANLPHVPVILNTSISGHTLGRKLTTLPEYNLAPVFTSLREKQGESSESIF